MIIELLLLNTVILVKPHFERWDNTWEYCGIGEDIPEDTPVRIFRYYTLHVITITILTNNEIKCVFSSIKKVIARIL